MRISDWSSDVCSSDLVKTLHADGRPVTDKEVADFYVFAWEEGERRGIEPSFEIHVNMWSEDFRRVATVARMVEARDRKSVVEGKSVSVSVDLGGRRIIKKKKRTINKTIQPKTT